MPNWKVEGSACVEDVDAVEPPPVLEPFDPGAHTIDEVKAYLADHPDETQQVYDAEVDGKARTKLLDWLTSG